MKSQYPYQASFVDLTGGPPSPQPACTVEEVTAIGICVQQSTCTNLTGIAFINCTTVECQDVLFDTSVSCRLCSGSEAGAIEEDLVRHNIIINKLPNVLFYTFYTCIQYGHFN